MASNEAPIARADWLPGALREWHPGQHVSVVGPTGSGKSRLAIDLLRGSRWVAAIGTKRTDGTLDTLLRDGYRRVPRWGAVRHRATIRGPRDERVIVWPEWRAITDDHNPIWEEALNSAWLAGGWTLFLDELSAISDRQLLRALYTQSRSSGVSLLAGTQRPRWVPVETWTEATYVAVFRAHHRGDSDAVADAVGLDRGSIRLEAYPPFTFAWIDVRTRAVSYVVP